MGEPWASKFRRSGEIQTFFVFEILENLLRMMNNVRVQEWLGIFCRLGVPLGLRFLYIHRVEEFSS